VRLAHGVETGLVIRTPEGEYREIEQPLAPADRLPLPYAGWAVPKRMQRLGVAQPAAPEAQKALPAPKQELESVDD
jgi:ubiquinol-cytochrome c reductase cytochrome b subunit